MEVFGEGFLFMGDVGCVENEEKGEFSLKCFNKQFFSKTFKTSM